MFSVTFSFDLMRKPNYSCFWNSWMFILDHDNNSSSLRNIVTHVVNFISNVASISFRIPELFPATLL